MLPCSTVLVEVTIIPGRILTLVARVLSSRFADPSVLHTRQVCCPVKLAVSLERASSTAICVGLLLHTFPYTPFL